MSTPTTSRARSPWRSSPGRSCTRPKGGPAPPAPPHAPAPPRPRAKPLAELTGAELHMPEGAPVSYPFSPLNDGDEIRIGEVGLRAVATPGHTPESTSYLLDGGATSGGLFTGDTLFLSAVGRPDLGASPEGAWGKARALHGSLRRVLELDPDTTILP